MADLLHLRPASGPLRGRVRVPGDKSISHRALIFAGLGTGRARIRGLLDSADVRSSRACMEALGLQIQAEAEGIVVEGLGGQLQEPAAVLDCGNSGTTMRLLCGLLAGQDFHAVLSGDGSLSRRPMARVTGPLVALGAHFDGRHDGRYAPLAVRGQRPLAGGRHDSPVASAQVKSALLLAGLQAEAPVKVVEPTLSRDHSERLLVAMGADLRVTEARGGQHAVTVHPGPALELVDIDVPGDLSSATFLLVAATLVAGSRVELEAVGTNPTRTGALEVLAAMGARIEHSDPCEDGPEPRATLAAVGAALAATEVGGALVPRLIDEIPILAVAAAFADGQTTFRDAAELRVKESDRVARLVELLRALGAPAEELPDGLVVQGSAGADLPGGEVDAAGDHRLAMAAAVASLRCRDGVRLRGADAVDVSFPGFFSTLEALRG